VNGPDLVGEALACRRGARPVFAGISFRLAAGGALVLSGRNGSGKSSLLRLIAGLLQPAAGRLLWGSAPIAADLAAYRARLAYVGHLDAVKPGLTPREMLTFWAALHAVRAQPETAFAAFGLARVMDLPCRWLSAGQRRRLALTRLAVTPTPLWLLDEPTSALDGDGQARLEAAIAAHRRDGGRVVVATHTPIALDGAAVVDLDAFGPIGAAGTEPAW
jgi:heme exporter protein A